MPVEIAVLWERSCPVLADYIYIYGAGDLPFKSAVYPASDLKCDA